MHALYAMHEVHPPHAIMHAILAMHEVRAMHAMHAVDAACTYLNSAPLSTRHVVRI